MLYPLSYGGQPAIIAARYAGKKNRWRSFQTPPCPKANALSCSVSCVPMYPPHRQEARPASI